MKVVILAGGLGTRLCEETSTKPKPMVEIGEFPMIWHIMKYYAEWGLNEFIICLGYKGYLIKEYFSNYFLHISDVTINTKDNNIDILKRRGDDWKITLVDTGQHTMTGGRLKRVEKYIKDEPFCLTYGDGLCNVNISKLIDFHKSNNQIATVTAVVPPGRFGNIVINEKNIVTDFREKPLSENNYINGGYFVLRPEVLDLIEGDNIAWEGFPLNSLASNSDMNAFKHDGFWQPMDTLRERNYLEDLWNEGKAPWKIWD